MKIKFYGHACFSITFDDGKKLLIDPYDSAQVGYRSRTFAADYVACSHDHGDHNYLECVLDGYILVDRERGLEQERVKITPIQTSHDNHNGALRGANTMFLVESQGIKIVHCGDLGHELSQEILEQVRGCDILMIPVGGYYTIDATTAAKVTEAIEPLVVIPMHYHTEDCTVDVLAPREDFVEEMKLRDYAISEMTGSEWELDPEDLPRHRRVLLLDYAR